MSYVNVIIGRQKHNVCRLGIAETRQNEKVKRKKEREELRNKD
jgi:hypothetical protein